MFKEKRVVDKQDVVERRIIAKAKMP